MRAPCGLARAAAGATHRLERPALFLPRSGALGLALLALLYWLVCWVPTGLTRGAHELRTGATHLKDSRGTRQAHGPRISFMAPARDPGL
jgi:hypothetical protein